MSRRREIDLQITSLGEIRAILSAMRNLALMETRKIARVLATERRLVAGIDAALGDVVAFHPELLARPEEPREVLLLLGAERGFCGDFSERIIAAAEAHAARSAAAAAWVAVGYKLGAKLADAGLAAAGVDGASVLEDVEAVLPRVADAIGELGGGAPLRLNVVHHSATDRDVLVSTLDPSAVPPPSPPFTSPPLANLPPRELMRSLMRFYVEAHLRQLFHESLLAENELRLEHTDRAIDHLDGQVERLRRRRDALRQEEITQEIELILLTAEALGAS